MSSQDARASVQELRQLLSTYKELYMSLRKTKHGMTTIKGMIGDPYKTSDDSWLIKAGLAMIAFPDPTISDLLGTGMVLIGLVKKRTAPLTISEVNRKLRSSMRELKDVQLASNSGID